jgi:hypothetical protein
MDRKWTTGIVSGTLLIIVVALVVTLLLVKLLWAWTIPDIFPGAVEEGLIAEQISWLTSFKVACFVAVLTGLMKTRRRGELHTH